MNLFRSFGLAVAALALALTVAGGAESGNSFPGGDFVAALAIQDGPSFWGGSCFRVGSPITPRQMNKHGNPRNLVAAQPGNLNAVKQGIHSPRLIQGRAAEIVDELTQSFAFLPPERLAVHEAARCIAILEAIDRDLDERGLVDKKGEPRYLLNYRARVSRQLEQWLEKVSRAIERQSPQAQPPPEAEFADYVRALQQIALGDATATARDRLEALNKLLKLGLRGTSSYLEGGTVEPELARRWRAIYGEERKRDFEKQERRLGFRQ